jgi:signal transduction histidine kinase
MSGNNPDYPLYSISEISKRTNRLGLAVILIGCLITAFFCFYGLYFNAITVAVLCSSVGLILFLSYKKIISNTKFPLIVCVSFWFILTAANDGGATGQYLFFFPMIVAIPIIVENQKTYHQKLIFYFIISTLSFVACIAVGHYHQPWRIMPDAIKQMLFYINAISAIIITVGFAYINISLERKYLQELIDQKNRTIISRTQFLSTMGHELRTPLNGIIGAINILKNEKSLPEQQEYFDILKYCSDHMLHQVNDVLDFNKMEAGKLEIHPVEVNLKQLLVNSTIPFGNQFEEKNIELKVEIDPELDMPVMADDVRLIQVMNNLLSNAGKFTNSGYIKLSVKVISKTKENFLVDFSLEDTGVGIAEIDKERIFDTFGQVYDKSTRKYTGSGLGLTICVQILKLMGSTLELKSEKGKGSTFSFKIAFDYLDQQSLNNNHYKEKTDLKGVNILLVEDNQINMIIAKKILMDLKATCTKAYNGQEALDTLAENTDYQIVLMDLEMPVMDGYSAVKEIKKNWPNLPVLAFTATLMDLEMLENLKAIGFTDCILKPFQPLNLLAKIKTYALEPTLNSDLTS